VNKQYWRLLELGECVQRGDEYHLKGDGPWVSVEVNDVGDVIDHGHVPYRRRITLPEPQSWISVKERMPTKEDANKQGNVLWIDNEFASAVDPWDFARREWNSHWTTIPDDPEPDKDADEEAWEIYMKGGKYANALVQASAHDAFLAGRKSVATEGGGK